MRLAKYVAERSSLSRRQAEEAIKCHRVNVNGVLVTHMTCFVSSQDRVDLDGVSLESPEVPCLWKCYKPRGCLVTRTDPFNRPTIYTELSKPLPLAQRFIYVGRLDFDSEGLLLMTNTSILAHILENPKYGWKRYYRVEIQGVKAWSLCKALKEPISYNGIQYKGCQIQDYSVALGATWLTVILTEGKKREIRNRLKALNLVVLQLIRIQFATIKLEPLHPKEWKEVPKNHWESFLLL
ncbi:pseudouridine synthase [Holospora undulata]|uniref:Putative RNA pseudouridine synthase n=1 Tax=Holospora undulata HU1 TaxID=1321371 RepID=A0A061JIR5_9PROT|nr:pseudouridine synthase [Holospora undulata]ETZ05553.1 putative RNA pseudouridine synthase [Holospora undulata HU1]